MFNKANAKLPPMIKRWVIDMQDFDHELVYKPEKDEQDPLDFLSRQALAVTGTDKTEKITKSVINAEHAGVVDRNREETKQYRQLQNLYRRILKGDWEKYKRNLDIKQYYSIKDKLDVVDGLIFRLNQIIIPEKLQRSFIKATHSKGHHGMTKRKQMLRQKYWFPEMNKRVESMIVAVL